MNSKCLFYRLLTLLLVLVLGAGVSCKRHADEDTQEISVKGEDAECFAVVCVDLSGSFADKMANDGKAYEFILRVADRYFRNSIGTNNRLVIAQLSATDRALLWDGTPVQLRQQFPTANDFRDFLLKKSNPNGSRLYDGISDAFDYVLSEPSINIGKTHAAVFVLSDFDDNLSGPTGEQRLAQSLGAFAKTKGVVGFYFLEHSRVPKWRQALRDSGIKQWVCESEIVADPPLPSFE